MKPDMPRQPLYRRLHLRNKERRLTQIMRDQVAAAASLLEMLLSVMVLIGLLVSTVPIVQEMFSLWFSDNTDAFQTFLGHAFNLVIGIEFIKMLAKELRISVITTKRAYEDLETEGFIRTMPGRGSFVAPQNPELHREESLKQVEGHLQNAIEAARRGGISLAEVTETLQLLWEG